MQGYAYIEGRTCPLDQAQLPFLDRGHLLGDGVFETLRAIDGRILFSDRHQARFRHGIRALGMQEDAVGAYHDAIDALLDAGQGLGPDLSLRIQASTGDWVDVTHGTGLRVTGSCRPTAPYPFTQVHLATSDIRLQRNSPLAGVKSLSFLPYIAARRQAKSQGADDALLCNDAGRIAEASTSNIMAFVDGRVCAPGVKEGALGGVTRDIVLEIVHGMGLEVQRRLEVDELRRAHAAWCTNTTGGIVPIAAVDGHPIAQDALVETLQDALDARRRAP